MDEVLWTVLVVAITSAAWAPFYRTPLYQDQSLHLYIGGQWRKGRIPYRDYSFALGPHLALLYALLALLCGKNERRINLLSMLYLAIGNVILFWAVKVMYGPMAAVSSSLFFAFYIFSPRLMGDRLTPESYATPPLIAAFVCLLATLGRTEPVIACAAGFFLGVAGLFRQSAYFYAVPLFGVLFFYAPLAAIPWAAGGFLLIHLFWIAYFAVHGATRDYLRASLWYAVSIAFFGNAKGPGKEKSDPMMASRQRMVALLKTNSATILPLHLLATAGLISLTVTRVDPYGMTTGLFFLTGIALIFPRWNFDCCYWLNTVPWASVLGGMTCGLLMEGMLAGFVVEHAVILAFALGFLFYVYLFDSPLYGTLDPEKRNAFVDPQKRSHASWWKTYDQIGAYLKETTKPSDRVLVLGHAARILNASDREAFFYAPSFVLFKMKPYDVEEYRRFRKAITGDYPEVIVLAGHMPAFPFNPQPYLKDVEEISAATGVLYAEKNVIDGFPIYVADREKSYMHALLRGTFRNERLKAERGSVSPETLRFEDQLQRGNLKDALLAYLDSLDKAERHDDGIFAIRMVIDLKTFASDPDSLHTLLILLGEMLYKKGSIADAEKTFQGILGVFPGSAQALNDLGAMRLVAGNRGEALLFFRRALDADPQNEDARANLEVLSAQ